LSRKRRRTLPTPAAVAAPVPAIEPEPVAAVIETEPGEDEALLQAVQRAISPSSEDAMAIRRLRDRLIDKLFTPDRSLNSWTELKATN
jgi:hypothetical protein